MRLQFPNNFFWGTSTAAAQIETASDHNWKGFRALDGSVFERTSDHEKRRDEDAEHIARFGTIYRCGVDWARLQTEPFGSFHQPIVDEYRHFFENLTKKNIKIMFVLHHFAHPRWFEDKGGWLYEENAGFFSDFVKKCIHHFGKYVSFWNTFNEPNVFALQGYITGTFPPHKKGIFRATEVLNNMAHAHKAAYTMLKVHDKHKPIGISLNTGYFKGKNIFGWFVARFMRYWFINLSQKKFQDVDFLGISYYAYILFDPFPITELHRPGYFAKRNLPHDKMWGYKPEGLLHNLRILSKKYQKPIIITENGVCTDDDAFRVQALKDYLRVVHTAIREGIDIQGYIYWSTFDNFEWNLGNTYRFGLLRVENETKNRLDTEGARFYEKITKENAVDV